MFYLKSKLITNYKYYLLNLFGWVFYIMCTLALDKISYALSDTDVSYAKFYNYLYYQLVESALCGLLGFVLSFVILYYIERHFKIGNLRKKHWWSLALVFVCTQILYHLLLWPMLCIPTNYYFGRDIELNFWMKLTNVPYFTVAFLVWLFIVLAIKFNSYMSVVEMSRLKLRSTLKETQLNALQGQINPHFMFNSLNNIRGLVLENPAKSREMITRLSEMLRYTLTKSEINTISLEEEIEMVENFIAISKIQLEDRLQFVLEVEKSTLSFKIPPMIIQMLIENAVKHGISQLKDGGIVSLKVYFKNAVLHIEVANTGQLAQDNNSTHVGIKNIQKRLDLLYDDHASFELVEKDNQVVARIVIKGCGLN
jgi:two-component system LytT family sensor kinase